MSSVRRRRQTTPVVAEAELAAIAPTLFARPALWSRIKLAPAAARHAGAAPWSTYWSVRLGSLAEPARDREALELAHAAFVANNDRLGATLAAAAAIETYYFDETELEPMDAWIARLDASLKGADSPWPNPECCAEVMSCGSAIRLRQPSHPRLAEWAAYGPRSLPHLARVPSRIKYAAFVAHYHLWRGEFASSALVFDALPGIDLALLRPTETLLWLEGLATHARFTGEFERGQAAIAEALALVRAHGLASQAYGVHSIGAALALAAHDAGSAAEHLQAMRSALSDRSQSDQANYWHLCAGLALLRGDTPGALALARSTLEQAEAVGGAYRNTAYRLSLALVLLAKGDLASCEAEAQVALVAARAIDAALPVFSCALLASHALERLGRRGDADRLLAEALALGAERDFALTAGWWLPAVVAERLARALQTDVEPAYARRLARRAGLHCPDPALEGWPWTLALRGFGEFSVRLDGTPLSARGARIAQRPLDLLRALLAHGGNSLPVASALEWLWPDADHEQQRKAFDAALLRLRRMLGDETLLTLDGGRLVLDTQRCWSDVAALAALEAGDAPASDDAPALLARAEQLLAMVRGPLLDGLETPWAMAARERTRRRFVLALAPLAQQLEAHAPQAACRLYERALQADPLAESLSRRLIAAQLARGERAEALRAWHHCKAMLALHGAAPTADTVALARSASFPV